MPDLKNYLARQHEIDDENKKVQDGKGNPPHGVTQQVNRNVNANVMPGYGENYSSPPSPPPGSGNPGTGKAEYQSRYGEPEKNLQTPEYAPVVKSAQPLQSAKEQSRQIAAPGGEGIPYQCENDREDAWEADGRSSTGENGWGESDDDSVQSPFSRQDFAAYSSNPSEGHMDRNGYVPQVEYGIVIATAQAQAFRDGCGQNYPDHPEDKGYENFQSTLASTAVAGGGYDTQTSESNESEDEGGAPSADFSDDGELLTISVDDLYVPSENSYSVDPDEISSLADSIADLGVLENLVVASLDKDSDRYAILSGQRRYIAVKKLISEGRLPADYQLVCKVRELDRVEVPDAGKLDSETAMLYLIATGNETRTLTPEDRLLRTRQLGKVFDRIKESGGQQRSIPKKDFISQCLGMGPRDAQRLINIEDNGSDLLKSAFSSGKLAPKLAELISKMSADDQNEFIHLTPDLSRVVPETVVEFKGKKRKQAQAQNKEISASTDFPADELNELLNSFDPLDEYCISLSDAEISKDLADKILVYVTRIGRDRDGLMRVLKKVERQVLKSKLNGSAPSARNSNDEED